MDVLDLNSAWVAPFDPRRRDGARRAPREAREPPPAPHDPDSPALPFMASNATTPEANFYEKLFRADLSALTPFNLWPVEAATARYSAPPYFDHLGALIVAVREGDLARARAAAEALETEVLVERSAGESAPFWLLAAERAHDLDRSVLDPPPPPAGAYNAYETLVQYLESDGPTA